MIGAKGKEILSLLLTIGILAGMLPAAAFAAGENKVSTQEQLQNMGEGSYVLTADITLDETWNPDQWGDLGFNGTLDGNGYTITLAGQPLFSAVRGTVRNLCLTGEVSGAAALTNTMASGTVENCLTDANVTNEGTFSNAYGLVGTLSAGEISNCLSAGALTAGEWGDTFGIAGGGGGTYCEVTNCYFVNGTKGVEYGSHAPTKISADESGYQTALNGLNQNADGEGLLYWAMDDDKIPKPTREATGGEGGEPTDPPQAEVNKDTLNAAIATAEEIVEQGQGDYTEDSWATFQSALEAAKKVADRADATQKDVDDAASALTEAQGQLKTAPSTGSDTETARAALEAVLDTVPDSQVAEDGTKYYTAETWNAMQEQIDAANKALENDQATAETLNAAAQALETVIAALKTADVPQPVTPPEGTEWEMVSTAEELETALASGSGYYKLSNDIEGVFGAGMQTVTFSGVLDGDGHVVTLQYGDTVNDRSYRLVDNIGATGVIQNLGIAGKCQSEPFADKLSGKLINCFSWAETVNGSGGMVGAMNSGSMIVNCYTSTVVDEYSGGLIDYGAKDSYIIYSYWQSGAEGSPWYPTSGDTPCLIGSSHKTETEMKQADFIALLNSHRGTTGMEWTLSDNAYPWQGEASEGNYFEYPVVLTDLVSGKETESLGPDFPLETDVFGLTSGDIAQLSLKGYEGNVRWEDAREDNSVVIIVGEDGSVFAEEPGTIPVNAYGDNGLLASVQLRVTVPEEYTLQLYVDGQDYTNKTYTLTGSEEKNIVPYVTYDKEEPVRVYASLFSWASTDESVFSMMSTGDVWVHGAGTADVTATLGTVSAKVTINTTYVPATGITCNYNEENSPYYLHLRNPNSIGQNDTPGVANFNPLQNNNDITTREKIASVLPQNASYTEYDVAVSDESILLPGVSLVPALVPLKAGEVDVTVTTKDPHLKNQLSDTRRVTIEYLNPLTSLTAENESLTVATGEAIDAGLIFTGPYSSADSKPESLSWVPDVHYGGLHVSESYMTWEQSSSDGGKVRVYRNYPIYMPGDEGYHYYESSVSMDRWLIEGVSEGTVTLVGTPADVTYEGDPITLTVTVTKGDIQPDLSAKDWTEQALAATGEYMYSTIGTPSFGAEWGIFGLARAGYNVSEDFYETYYASVVEEVQKQEAESAPWDNTVTDTQRIALALTAIGKDPTDVGGVNLLDYSWNKETNMPGAGALGDRQGSNELIYALLAIDAYDGFTQPESVSMTTDQMIDKLLSTYQLEDGGFGLSDNKSTSVDVTAMAIQALAKHRDREEVQEAIDKALSRLAGMQDTRGDFGNAESTAQVIVALTELGIDPDENDIFQYSLVDGLKLYEQEDGSFSHSLGGAGNGMATEQAYYTLAALHRFYQNNAFTLYDMNDVSFGADGGTAVTNVALRPESGSIRVGRTLQLTATVVPYTAENKAVTWSSSDPSVATVDENGLVTGMAAGEAIITVTTVDGNKTATATITVTDNSGGGLPGGDDTITVTISVDKLTIDKGYVLEATEVEAEEGATVWDVFQQVMDEYGIDYEYEFNEQYNSVYIQSIDGDGEFEHGPGSGWMYNVNGTYPEVGASVYELEDGDEIQWRYTTNLGADLDDGSNGATSGSGGAGGSGSSAEGGGSVVLEPSGSADANGRAEVSIDEDDLKDAIAEVKSGAADELVIAPEISGDAAEIALTLPVDTLEKLVRQTEAALMIETGLGMIAVPNETVSELAAAADGRDITFTITTGTTEQAAELLDGKAEDVSEALLKQSAVVEVTITSKEQEITEFGDETIDLYLPVNAEQFESGKNYTVYQISGDGSAEKLTGKCMRRSGQLYITVTVSHLSTFVILPQDEVVELPFADVEGHWAFEAIEYAYRNGLLIGISDTAFAPDDVMDRAMLVTILYRMEGEPEVTAANTFTDVPAGTWYTDAVIWADANDIVNGVGNGRFAPTDNITREQMAVMLYRYAQYKNYECMAGADLSSYTDAADVSTWALDAVEWANAEGLITGRTAATIVPGGTATRAEAAMILMRFLESVAADK